MKEILTEGSIVALIVGLVIGFFKLIEKIWPNKHIPFLQCPNKIETLAGDMIMIKDALIKVEENTAETRGHAIHLLGQHAPEGGVEQWKIPSRMIPLLEDAVKQGELTLSTMKQNHTEMIRVLEKIANRRDESR